MFDEIVEKIVEKDPGLKPAYAEIKKRAENLSNDQHVQDKLIYIQVCALGDGFKYAQSFFKGDSK